MVRKITRARVANREAYETNLYENKFQLKSVRPKTENQKKFFENYQKFDAVGAIGSAGSGKTYCAIALALNDVIVEKKYDRIIYLRTAVQARDQGFMTGNHAEKMSYYEVPLIDTVNDLMQNPEAYSILKRKKVIEFMSSSFIRGLTFSNTVVIFDECQNASIQELRSVMTRLGENSKIVFCGDTKQNDLVKKHNDVSGLPRFLQIAKRMKSFSLVTFSIADIVRSGIVKEFIIAEEEYEAA